MKPFGVLGFFHRKLCFFEVIYVFFAKKDHFKGFLSENVCFVFFGGILSEIPPFLGRELSGNCVLGLVGVGLGCIWDVVGRGGQPSEGKDFDLHPPPLPVVSSARKGKRGVVLKNNLVVLCSTIS